MTMAYADNYCSTKNAATRTTLLLFAFEYLLNYACVKYLNGS